MKHTEILEESLQCVRAEQDILRDDAMRFSADAGFTKKNAEAQTLCWETIRALYDARTNEDIVAIMCHFDAAMRDYTLFLRNFKTQTKA